MKSRTDSHEYSRHDLPESERSRHPRRGWMLRTAAALIALLLTVLSAASCGTSDKSGFREAEGTTDYVRISVRYTAKDGTAKSGSIYIQLFPETAPITVANFQSLVAEGFYDGLTFHRVYPGFMIQGGDPKGDGTGSSGQTIKGEFSENGVENTLSHKRGVVSMARGSYSMDSASCQFFIVQQDATYLDGSYAAFGRVVYGMDVVDAITQIQLTRTAGSIDRVATKPVKPVTIQSIVFVTK